MIPAIEILGKTIYPYVLLSLIGVFAAGLFAIACARRRGVLTDDMIVFLLIAAAGALIGGHILYGIVNLPVTLPQIAEVDSLKSFFAWCVTTFGGSVFYGGFLGGAAAALVFIRRTGRDAALYSDVMAPTVPLFHVFGRIGCFLGGCCYGVESDWGFVYHHSLIESANGVMRLPIQLIEASCNLVLFAVLAVLFFKGRFRARLFSLYLMSYPVIRFVTEFWRGDEYRGFLFGLSTSQLISIPLFVIGVLWFVRGRKAEQ